MAQKNLFRDILRLITPEEVAVLTDTVLGRQKVMLKLIVQEDLGLIPVGSKDVQVPVKKIDSPEVVNNVELQAKIIPFEIPMSEQTVAEPMLAAPSPENLEEAKDSGPLNDFVKINEDGSVIFKEEELEVAEKVDMTEFILSEREKCKEISFAMKKKEVMELYNKNATIDLSRERAQKKDASRKHNDGILINRKQG